MWRVVSVRSGDVGVWDADTCGGCEEHGCRYREYECVECVECEGTWSVRGNHSPA